MLLAERSDSPSELIKNTYEFVRDQINYPFDRESKAIACRASDVLRAGEGLDYSKSHLLAALLRHNKIPAGFCYQLRRSTEISGNPLILHCLTAVFIEDRQTWIKPGDIDDKSGICTQFSSPYSQLAYQLCPENGEIDFPVVFVAPDDGVVHALTTCSNLSNLRYSLPKYPAKLAGCETIKPELVSQARCGINPVGYCGHHCQFCFLAKWCGGCRSSYNCCSFATLHDGNTCPHVSCAKSRNLNGCYECEDLSGCNKGYYEREAEYVAKASALFIKRYGEDCYTATLKQAIKAGVNYPETFDSSGSVKNALAIFEKFNG